VRHVNGNASNGKTKANERLPLDVLRVGDLSKLARQRYSDGNRDYVLPETADGRLLAMSIITHQRFKPDDWVFNFCRDRAPWLDPRDIDRSQLRPQKADALGCDLGLTSEARTRLGIHTIGPCDQTRAYRLALAKERKREKDRVRRHQGRQPRTEYLASHSTSRTKPWEAEGMSRAKWYRLRRETSMSPCKEVVSASTFDTPVSRVSPARPRSSSWYSSPPDSGLSPGGAIVYDLLAHLLRMRDARSVPVGVLTDGDPHGRDIPVRVAA
jgi:hypothetical protein